MAKLAGHGVPCYSSCMPTCLQSLYYHNGEQEGAGRQQGDRGRRGEGRVYED